MGSTKVLGPAVVAALALTACNGDITGGGDGDGADAGVAAVAFVAPAAGSTHVRDALAPDGFLAADVPVAVEVTGADDVEVFVGDRSLGTVDAAGDLDGLVRELGPVTLTARAHRDGAVVAEATLDVETVDPEVADCHGWLDLYQLDYTLGPNNQGVADPVTLTTPINGMVHRYVSNTSPRQTFFMDCSLARSLAQAAAILRSRGVVEVADIGVYNYRCIGGEGTPPDCPRGMSQHAYAKAIDLAGFTLDDGSYAEVKTDWVIDPDGEPTCEAPAEPGADQWLHDTICALKRAGVWNIVLTPNYNADHRDHFHVDLTSGADFIERQLGGPALPAMVSVDVGPDDL